MNKKASPYLSVGIDIGADFSLMAIALPSQELVGSPYRIVHKSQRSLEGAVDRIFTLMKQYDLPARVYMESTGIYHFPMYHKMKDAGLDAFILNPLVTHAAKDSNVRNVHNDRFDAQKIALLLKKPEVAANARCFAATSHWAVPMRDKAVLKPAQVGIMQILNQAGFGIKVH